MFATAVVLLTCAPASAAAAGGSSLDLAPLTACPGQADAAAPPSVKRRAMRCLVNWARGSHGLQALRGSGRLNRSSMLRAEAIRRCAQFSHTPCGQSFAAVFARVGYLRGATVGENLAWGGGALGSARNALQSWLGSPEHRSNLLRRGWRDLGIGLVRADQLFGAGDVSVWVTQFGRR